MSNVIFSPLVVGLLAAFSMLALALAFRPTRASRLLETRLSAFISAVESRDVADALGDVEGSFAERVLIPGLRNALRFIGRLTPGQNMNALNDQLTAAGRPGNLSAADFLGIRLLVMAVCVVAAIVVAPKLGFEGAVARLLAPVAGLVIGYLLPRQWLEAKVAKRRDLIQCSLPDALDMLTICVEAGLAFESALQRVADQWQGPLSDEFARAVSEMRLGVPRPQSLRRLAQRCDTPDVSSFVAVLVQADAMGTSVAQVLHSQSDQIRTLRRQRAEEKANKAPIKVLLAMVIFIFPALFVVILGPAVPRIMDAFSGTGMP